MATKRKTGLGRGLGALIDDAPSTQEARTPTAAETLPASGGVARIPVASIGRNPHQPRARFEAEAMRELVESVAEHGILQPLLLRRVQGGYELIAGERRLRAARTARLVDVPALVVDVDDQTSLEMALIENLQRADLNAIEEALGYRELMERFDLTQEQVAQRVGKGRTSVTNALRLLSLSDKVRQLVIDGHLSGGHAKALAGVEIAQEQELLARRAVNERLSVRQLEGIIARNKRGPQKRHPAAADIPSEHLRDLTDRLQQFMGTAVRIEPCKTLSNGKKIKGRVEIDFFTSDDLDRVLTLLGVRDDL